MTRKNPALSSIKPNTWASTEKGALREAIEKYLLDHNGCHAAASISQALNVPETTCRRKLAELASAGVAINTNPRGKPTLYQHREHWSRENRVNRRDPITNAGMDNGSRSYWAKHMTAFNTPPRGQS